MADSGTECAAERSPRTLEAELQDYLNKEQSEEKSTFDSCEEPVAAARGRSGANSKKRDSQQMQEIGEQEDAGEEEGATAKAEEQAGGKGETEVDPAGEAAEAVREPLLFSNSSLERSPKRARIGIRENGTEEQYQADGGEAEEGGASANHDRTTVEPVSEIDELACAGNEPVKEHAEADGHATTPSDDSVLGVGTSVAAINDHEVKVVEHELLGAEGSNAFIDTSIVAGGMADDGIDEQSSETEQGMPAHSTIDLFILGEEEPQDEQQPQTPPPSKEKRHEPCAQVRQTLVHAYTQTPHAKPAGSTATGEELQQLQFEIDRLKQENSQLRSIVQHRTELAADLSQQEAQFANIIAAPRVSSNLESQVALEATKQIQGVSRAIMDTNKSLLHFISKYKQAPMVRNPAQASGVMTSGQPAQSGIVNAGLPRSIVTSTNIG